MTAPTSRDGGLLPYQFEATAAILKSIIQRRGHSFSVEIARQGGKNELSARLELVLLAAFCDQDVTSIKAAPTLQPQALISMGRLWRRVQAAGLERWARKENGNCIRLGRARQLFLSAEAGSNIVGHTADLLLEVDEAQDVDIDKYDKELRPMAASSGATTVLYGTAWDDASLLERARQEHLEAERRDGVRRHFEYDWRVVAGCNPKYEAFVTAERERLGAEHPLFASQYCLQPLPGAGRLLGPTQLALLRGSHSQLEGPRPGETYVAGLDVAGEATEGSGSAVHDATVLTIGRLREASDSGRPQEPAIEVVRHYAWSGARHVELYGALVSLLRETWRVRLLVVDATGIGEPVAAFLAQALGPSRVEGLKLGAASKSSLGFALLAAVNSGRLRLYDSAGSRELQDCLYQLQRCRAVYRPNGGLSFFVEPGEGHDDYVISLALLVSAAVAGRPRPARGRLQDTVPA